MNKQNRYWLWLSAAVSMLAGFILVLSDSAAGWFLIILGIIDIGLSARPGQASPTNNPTPSRWIWIAIGLLTILFAIILAVIVLV